jgi:hypothetical protein
MSAVAVSSSLNPNAPLFIPAALLQVEDFSPQWWDLITTTAWFRDHWSREHAHLDEIAEQLELVALLAYDEDEDLFYGEQASAAAALKTGTDLSLLLFHRFLDLPKRRIIVSSSAYVGVLFLRQIRCSRR